VPQRKSVLLQENGIHRQRRLTKRLCGRVEGVLRREDFSQGQSGSGKWWTREEEVTGEERGRQRV
jgi:hypothetical protein